MEILAGHPAIAFALGLVTTPAILAVAVWFLIRGEPADQRKFDERFPT